MPLGSSDIRNPDAAKGLIRIFDFRWGRERGRQGIAIGGRTVNMTINASMRSYLGSGPFGPSSIPAGDREPLQRSRFVVREGCYFLDVMYEHRGNAVASMFPDATGYECLVNHIHLDGPNVDAAMSAAVAAMCLVDAKWRESEFAAMQLRHIVHSDTGDDSCVYRCHLVRDGESWLTDDIDRYADFTLTAVSSSE